MATSKILLVLNRESSSVHYSEQTLTMDFIIRDAVENYNKVIQDGRTFIKELKEIEELQGKAERSALAFLKQSTKPGTPEQQDFAKDALRFVIANIASVWKPIAVDLVEQKEKCDLNLQAVYTLRNNLNSAIQELARHKKPKRSYEIQKHYLLKGG